MPKYREFYCGKKGSSARYAAERLGCHVYLDKKDVDALINKLITLRGQLNENSILTIHQSPFADDTYITIRADGIETTTEEKI